MSQHHEQIKNDPRWKQARDDTLDRDGYTCTRCDETEGLQVDHIVPLAEVLFTNPDLAFDLANLQTLCRPCHDEKGRADAEQPRRLPWVHADYTDLIGDLVFSETPTGSLGSLPLSHEPAEKIQEST